MTRKTTSWALKCCTFRSAHERQTWGVSFSKLWELQRCRKIFWCAKLLRITGRKVLIKNESALHEFYRARPARPLRWNETERRRPRRRRRSIALLHRTKKHLHRQIIVGS